jgi:hypothetical protein
MLQIFIRYNTAEYIHTVYPFWKGPGGPKAVLSIAMIWIYIYTQILNCVLARAGLPRAPRRQIIDSP